MCSLLGDGHSFFAYGVLDNDVINACLSTPLTQSIPQGSTTSNGLLEIPNYNYISQSSSGVPSLSNGGSSFDISATSLSLADRL